MCKKIGIAAVVVAVVLFLLNSTMLGSYTGTAWSKIHGSFKKQVPIEFEIERIKHEIAQLVPDMKKNLSSVAEEMVAIDNLKEEILADIRNRLKVEKTQEELQGEFANDPTVAVEKKTKSTPELSHEIRAYFENSENPDKVAADKK